MRKLKTYDREKLELRIRRRIENPKTKYSETAKFLFANPAAAMLMTVHLLDRVEMLTKKINRLVELRNEGK